MITPDQLDAWEERASGMRNVPFCALPETVWTMAQYTIPQLIAEVRRLQSQLAEEKKTGNAYARSIAELIKKKKAPS